MRIPETVLDPKEYVKEEIDTHYIDAIKSIHSECSKFLINFNSIKNEIYQLNKSRFTHNQKSIFNELNF